MLRRYFLAAAMALCMLVGELAFLSAAAHAARGHVFEKSFGEPCPAEPAPCGAGQFKEPAGVAVNESTEPLLQPAAGDVYVVDKGNNRVEYFTSDGTYVGEFAGPTAAGAGTLASGSNTIESVTTATGAFSVGEEISAPGLPAGTTITAVQSAGVLEVSQLATASESASLAAHQSFSAPEGIAVDNSTSLSDPSAGAVYVVDTGNKVIDKFSATGEYLNQLTDSTAGTVFRELLGVAVDNQGSVWVYQGTQGEAESGELDAFDNSAANGFQSARASQASVFPHPGLTVDGHGHLYVVHRNIKVVAELDTSGAVLRDEIGGEASTSGVAVDIATSDIYIDNMTTVGVFGADGSALGTFGSGQLSGSSGVGVNAVSDAVYVADAAANVVDVFVPEAPSVPTVVGESVTDVTSESATLEGEVNPDGASTGYQFEYGRCASESTCGSSGYETSIPVPDGTVGSDFVPHSVSVHTKDLAGGNAYHFRLVAQNALNEPGTVVDGEERTFTTQSAGGGLALLDGRQWEMVSPPDKRGALIETIGHGQVTQAAGDGRAMSYVALAPTEPEPDGNANFVQVLSTRGTAGWESRDIAPPHAAATGLAQTGQEYRLFSQDLSTAVVQPFGPFIPSSSPLALAPAQASEQTAFLRAVYPGGNAEEPCVKACYRPLVTGASGYANVPEGTEFGICSSPLICGPVFVGATSDLSDVVLESGVPLTSTPVAEGGLYEWAGGRLALVSMLPGNTEAASHPDLGYNDAVARNAISADGSRVVWSEHPGHVYVRDMVRGETVQLDAVQGGSGENAARPTFQLASSDGSKVFFTAAQRLTADSGGVTETEADLYECDMVIVAGKLQCRLSDLTPARSGESAGVLDQIVGASEDGSWVYFVANGAFAGGAVHGACQGLSSQSGALCNLYVAHFNGTEWETQLVAVLSKEDSPDWNGDGGVSALGKMTGRVSPDGRQLAFMSQRALTGYDTRDAATGTPDEEVYLYHAETQEGGSLAAGKLVCASCDPTGARPVGVEYGKLLYGLDGQGVWDEPRRLAASVPAWTTYAPPADARYQPRYLSNSGRLFFNSSDALVPADVNGTGDVYEFEPAGVGGCQSSVTGATVVYVKELARHEVDGCLGMISSGRSAEESGFLDASESAGDVFFLTAAKLSERDFDTSVDVYDAHECTGTAPCLAAAAVQPPPCNTSDACKPGPSPQPDIFGAAPSATFSGPGNIVPQANTTVRSLTRAQKLARALKACKKRSRRKQRACQRQARRAYGPARRATSLRKAVR
jgi:hypothetical protein